MFHVMPVAERALRAEARADRGLRVFPVLGLTLALRAFAAALMFRRDPGLWFYDQASELSCLAHSVLAGHGLSSPFGGVTGPSAFLAPGYPLLVALVYRCFGEESLRAATVLTGLQICLGVLIVLTVMLVARRLFNERTAYIAGVLCAVSPTMVWLPTMFWETSVSTLLLVGVVALALWCADNPTRERWISMGAYCGAGMLVNPSLLLTFAGVAAWVAYRTRSRSRATPLLALAVCGLIFAVWPIRNAVALHAFVPLRSNLGYELWQGNRPGSKGYFTASLYLNANREEYGRYAAIGELAYMREKSAIASSAIRTDPIRFARLSMRRIGSFWTALGGHGMSRIVVGEITATSVFAMVGLVAMAKRRRLGTGLVAIPFLAFPLPYYVTHPDFRFRLVLEPLALMLTGWVLAQAYVNLKTRDLE